MKNIGILILTGFLSVVSVAQAQAQRWTEAKANAWYAPQPWLVGANYVRHRGQPTRNVASGNLRCSARVDKELGWAENSGMNMMRVFLPYILWDQDPASFKQRINTFPVDCREAPHPAGFCAL